LGGPQRIDDVATHDSLQEELELLRVRCHYGLPTIGISLGAQLLACVLGGGVRRMPQPEIGLAPLELTPSGRDSCLRPL
ncbi:glutamine amidotransferase-related protein, partial [Paraburkholderia sp. SIMBA_054]|uniref:glutamine amidotransferase-related protein n=1 Tax=Paraburkholderia sp. SIMBA_054 TaxID=3085795 RepID=UPI00397CDE10